MWKRYRRAVAWAEALLILGLPFLKINGLSAIRFDIPTLSLHFFGSVVRLSEFYFLLFATLFFLILIVWATAVFGRLWCGWLCPQTVLLDFAEDIAGWSLKNRTWGPKVVLLPLTALVSASLIWYFVPPSEFFQKVFHSPTVTGFFVIQWVVIYLELAFAGRKFCKYVCPYSMLQTALFDRDTLVITFQARPEEFEGKSPCLMCRSCEVVCPVEIDIKEGLQRQCIACASCIDACKVVTERAKTNPFISYSGRVLRPKAFVLAGVTIVFGIVMVLSVVTSPPVSVLIKRDAVQGSGLVNSYSYTITNNRAKDVVVEFQVEGAYVFIGEPRIVVPAFEIV
ncbi:MAG: 4Fe-4S binding protein, partial [Nitrospirae bacterium]